MKLTVEINEQDVAAMVNAHKLTTGKDAIQIVLPHPDIRMFGAKVLFHGLPGKYTVDKDTVLHHQSVPQMPQNRPVSVPQHPNGQF